jgi:hypothetical protein
LHTYSAVFPDTAIIDPRIDENRYIAAVLGLPGIEGHKVVADDCTAMKRLLMFF